MAKPPQFETHRTRRFRLQDLDQRELSTIEHVEQFGCEVIHVRNDSGPDWSYTVGVYDTCGQPEIIAIGLPEETAHHLLNEAACRLREGIDLSTGRQGGMVGEVECEFHPVDKKWLEHLMGWAIWYNGDMEFSAIQAIYPDLENRFPQEPEFDHAFAQPLLQPTVPFGDKEKDFWASADPNSSLFDWKFPDPPHTRVFLSQGVHSGKETVTYVSHDAEDGAWQFLGDSMSNGELPVICCFHHVIDGDATLKELVS